MTEAGVRFFSIADAAHHPGLVALVNSLRLQGHDEPVTVLDLGLTASQRVELAAHCDFVPPPPSPWHPWLLTPIVCRSRAAEVTVYLDCDMIVTAPLDSIIADARVGKFCAFPDRLSDRWFAEWEGLLELPGPPRHQTYLNAGFLAFSTRAFPHVLESWAELCGRLPVDRVSEVGIDFDDPLALPDQDVLNALLMTTVDAARLAVQPAATTSQGNWQLGQTDVVDPGTVACARDGRAVTLLHCFGSPKPWQGASRHYLPRTAYLVCLRRLLMGTGVAVRTAEPQVPWLTRGLRGWLSFHVWTGREAMRKRLRRV